jgi:hypothetical protein
MCQCRDTGGTSPGVETHKKMPTGIPTGLAAKQLLLASLLAASVEAQAGGFQPVRAPLFGLTLEHDAKPNLWRLVRERAGEREVLLTGVQDACETYMIKLLEREHGDGNFNLVLPTLGGRQLWGDEMLLAGWRIQRNVWTEHCRLLDPKDKRHAWGKYEACRVALEKQRFARRLAPRSERAVVLLHGLGRSRYSLKELAAALPEDGYEVLAIDYPSTRGTLAEHAAQVSLVLSRTEGMREISFVSMSLGGLVLRQVLADRKQWLGTAKVGRVVLIGAPNRGSIVADKAKDILPAQWILGEPVAEASRQAIERVPKLVDCEFAVIAGGKGNDRGFNPLIEGDNDGLLTVDSTKLEGMKDFLLVESIHTNLPENEKVIAAVRRFLKSGKLSE